MDDEIAARDENSRRIAQIENLFMFSELKLGKEGRVLVGEGVLLKSCRRRLKRRQVYLFNDLFLYAKILVKNKQLGNCTMIDMAELRIMPLEEDLAHPHSWHMLSPTKSFTLTATTALEKQQWVSHLFSLINHARRRRHGGRGDGGHGDGGRGEGGGLGSKDGHGDGGRGDGGKDGHGDDGGCGNGSGGRHGDSGLLGDVSYSAVWVPDDEASICMNCNQLKFSVVNRKHHCRSCGIVCCACCSSRRLILPHISQLPVRVCSRCHANITILHLHSNDTPAQGRIHDDDYLASVREKNYSYDDDDNDDDSIFSATSSNFYSR